MTTKALVASASLILAVVVIWRFRFLITPLVLAAILSYLLNPIISWLQSYLGLRRAQTVLIVYLLFLLIWIGGGVVLGFIVVEQSVRLGEQLPDLISRLVEAAPGWIQSWSNVVLFIGPYQIDLDGLLGPAFWTELSDEMRVSLQGNLGRGGVFVATVARSTLNGIGLSLLVLIVSIYVAIDGPKLGRFISDVAHQPGYRQDVDRLLREALAIWDAYLRGQITLALVIGVVVSIVLSLLGVNYALALGVVAGLLEFLPIIGPILSAILAVVVAVFQSDIPLGWQPWVYGGIVLAAMFFIQQIENYVLVPRIVGDALNLHPVEVIVVVLMGTSLAGLLGAILAAPVLATVKLVGGYVWRKMLDLPPFPEPEPGKRRHKHSAPTFWSRLFHVFGEYRRNE
jgi:predicted PurR-regulated permease PerM